MMEKLPARTGWLWIKAGFALFRKQPAEIVTLFISYLFVMLALNIIPVIGPFLPLVLTPVFAMTFMQACANVEQGQRVFPNLLLFGFRSPAFRTLLLLGVLYLAAAAGAILVSTLVDGGMFWKIISGQIKLEPGAVDDADISLAMLAAGAVYTPAAMAFWYAAPLAAWQRMPAAKAMFYSFFAVRKTIKAFLVYGLAWVALGVLLPSLVSTFAALLFGKTVATMVVLVPLSMILPVIVYCSFYPTYTDIFGKPYSTEENAEP